LNIFARVFCEGRCFASRLVFSRTFFAEVEFFSNLNFGDVIELSAAIVRRYEFSTFLFRRANCPFAANTVALVSFET